MEKPLVSVIMANYNCGRYIREAIDSIIEQTYDNWELIIVDDASTDGSLEVIDSFVDDRIVVITNEKNQGLAKSLNIGIEASRGADFVARLDSDDIALPDRIEKQLNYMLDHPNISICGANIEMFSDEDYSVIYTTRLKEDNASLMAYMPFSSPIPHSTWFVRMNAFDSFSYDIQYRSSQDYELMSRVLESRMEIACVPEVLVRYRVRSTSISHSNKGVDPNTLMVQCKIARMLGLKDEKEYVRIVDMESDTEKKTIKKILMLISYCMSMIRANRRVKLFNRKALLYTVTRQIYGATLVSLRKNTRDD